ncbi:D-sedoheptulose 7-phosphate isomerase [Pseudomonas sp. EL_65y_Pfl2_R95]|uniref:D-sedoheptulose 7-phosphate isomerase n=1 Tax=Pseudomonas sp. EL_65y_Pfl2_R95 TaxID=3088698 RepID=UPI0030D92FC7
MIEHIRNSLLEAQSALDNFINNEQTLQNIERAAQMLVDSFEHKGKAFSCGNGGSMCDAMHFAEELTGRYRGNRPGIAAVSISDASHISCVANDFGYEYIFSRYIESHGREGDVLLAFSTSGKSPNVLNAVAAAKQLGVKVIGLTGKPGSKLEELADVCICAPGGNYADRIQELHIKVVHILIELIERKLSPENYA